MTVVLNRFEDGQWEELRRTLDRLAVRTDPPVPQARVFNSAVIATTTGASKTLTFDSERFDNGSLHSTSANTSRLTAPITGIYEIGASIEWAANAVGQRAMFLQLNGTTVIVADNRPAGATNQQTVTTLYQLVANDYVEVVAVQTSTGNLNVAAASAYSPEFWMTRLGGYINQGV